MPTWHIMPRNDSNTMGVPRSLKHSTKVEGLPSTGGSSMGVTKSKIVERMPTTRKMAKSTRQFSPNSGMTIVAPHMAR